MITARLTKKTKIKDLFQEKPKQLPDDTKSENIMHYTSRNAMTNIIAQEAYATYSLRSSCPKTEKELLDKIKKSIDTLVAKYERRIKIDLVIQNVSSKLPKDFPHDISNPIFEFLAKMKLKK